MIAYSATKTKEKKTTCIYISFKRFVKLYTIDVKWDTCLSINDQLVGSLGIDNSYNKQSNVNLETLPYQSKVLYVQQQQE